MKTLYNKTNCLRMQNFDFRFNSSFRLLHFSFRLSLRERIYSDTTVNYKINWIDTLWLFKSGVEQIQSFLT